MTEDHPEASVPVDELKELVEVWEAYEEWHREQSIKHATGGKSWETFRQCIGELQEVVDRYE